MNEREAVTLLLALARSLVVVAHTHTYTLYRLVYRFLECCKSNVNGCPVSGIKSSETTDARNDKDKENHVCV